MARYLQQCLLSLHKYEFCMAENDIFNKKDLFEKFISSGRLHEAIVLLKSISEEKMLWEVTDRISRVEEAYCYMLRYAMDDVADPHRDIIYKNIKEDLCVIFERLIREVNARNNTSIYYSTLRTSKNKSISVAIDRYYDAMQLNSPFNIASGESKGFSTIEIEAIETELFEAIWTIFPYSSDDESRLNSFFEDNTIPNHIKIFIISALMLGGFEFWDSRRAIILAKIYDSDNNEKIKMTALTALVLLLYMNRDKEFPSEVIARIKVLRDNPQWMSDLKIIYLELIRTQDTDRITSKLRDEIVPEMMKIKPEIDKKFKDVEQGGDSMDFEENPEWQEFLESSGLADRMKELSEIQEEGGDVLMGTFSQLKSYPFFYNTANWFRPFNVDNSILVKLGDDTNVIGELIANSFFMCDSDKYSFLLALSSVPESQRNMMISQIKSQNINAAEIQNASLNLSPDSRKNIVNKYVQNLYRFFCLFRRKEDFNNPFATEINLTEVKPLQSDFLDDAMLQLVGEFYFKHKYYKEALNVFKLREAHMFPDATLYQKLGYCQHRLGNIEEAITYYEQSELLTGNSVWTTKRLASAYKQLGNVSQSLEYYQRLDAMQPDNFSTTMNIGLCSMSLGKYEQAIKAFYKAQYLDEESEKPLRPLAWSLLMNKDIEGAHRIYNKILCSTNIQPIDYLNRGHLSLVQRDFHNAILFYNKYISSTPGGWSDFIKVMTEDRSALLNLEVDGAMLPLVIDATKYIEINN